MRILFINQHPEDELGGSEIQCHLLANALHRLQNDVCYFAVYGNKKRYDARYNVIPGPLSRSALGDVLSDFKPEVVYFRANRLNLIMVGRCIREAGAIPVYGISALSDVKPWFWRGPNLNICSQRITYKWLKSFVRVLKNRWNYSGFKYFAGLTSLREALLDIVPVEKQILLRDVVYKDSVPFAWPRPYVVWVANLKKIKRPEIFVALAKGCDDLPVDFIMVGALVHGNYKWIAQLNELSNFCYLGMKSPAEVNGILAGSQFLVHTCQPEGFGNVFMQAWFNGKPTVTYEFDPDGIIESQRIGHCSGNFETLLMQTRQLIENPKICQEMGNRAQTFVNQHFDCDNNAKKLSMFFEELIISNS